MAQHRVLRGVKYYDQSEVERRVDRLAEMITRSIVRPARVLLYPVPPNGFKPAEMVVDALVRRGWVAGIVAEPQYADYFIDAAVNTGTMQNGYVNLYGKRFLALINKRDQGGEIDCHQWIVFPWDEHPEDDMATQTFDDKHYHGGYPDADKS
jgi:hypothetical protein